MSEKTLTQELVEEIFQAGVNYAQDTAFKADHYQWSEMNRRLELLQEKYDLPAPQGDG